jgi:hypothetical protein
MKRILLIVGIVLTFLLGTNGLKAQTSQPKLDQFEMYTHFIGSWQANVGKDTIEVWDCKQYGKAFVINAYFLVKDQKIPLYINNVSFDSKEGKFKGFVLWNNGGYNTWIGSYINEKDFFVEFVDNFNPEKISRKANMLTISPKERIFTHYNMDGVKISEAKYIKIK